MAKSSIVCISYRWPLGGRTSSRNRYIDNPHQFVCWIVFSPLLSGAAFDSHARYDVSTPKTLLFIDVFSSDILDDMVVLETETSTCWRGIFFLACNQQRRDCTWYSQRLPAFFLLSSSDFLWLCIVQTVAYTNGWGELSEAMYASNHSYPTKKCMSYASGFLAVVSRFFIFFSLFLSFSLSFLS